MTSTPEAPVGRFSLDKRFHGDLEGESHGEMLAMQGEVAGSAGYVAMERVTARVGGRSGSFAMLHRGLMERGRPTLVIEIVPDSGTGDLAGIAGTLDIEIADGRHSYALNYFLPDSA